MSDAIDYQIYGAEMQFAEVTLDPGEMVLAEAGAMMYMTSGIKMESVFGDPNQQWMINFRVRNLDKMAAQLRGNGIAVEVDPELYPNGRFAQLKDVEGNPIQLWQPGGKDPG